ncbi:WD40 repeat [Fusarium albosuccineum]|uniref:Autophagy-related protein 1 n=1 Tax=Fusarium albosuccineum TaxID=1237068 RepID=A0A8H4PD06_9HYPO|nr:WD40 repeat [Fusarium albosuccineum]
MTTNPAPLSELVRDFKLDATTFQDDLTIHTQPLGRRRRTERWRRRQILGFGGYGVVWLEQNEDRDAPEPGCRAVKVVRGKGSVHYARELEALAKFSQDKYSDFFVKFLGWYENPESDYLHIAMEYCPHGDLKKYLAKNGGRLPESDVKDIASQVLAGVVMMHRAGFANRDIKPGNILIKSKPPSEWWVKICDFGLSKRAEGFTATTTVRGTPEFMPPEILGFSVGSGRTDAFMVDMWCLGETVFQALTGRPVFETPADVGRYLEGGRHFPFQVLSRANASHGAVSFIMSLMRAWPLLRITSEEAIKHPWMHDMTLETAFRAPETPSVTTQSRESPYQSIFPSGRAPGDQLTQASGQWTTTMAFRSQTPSQQQAGLRPGNPYDFLPPYFKPTSHAAHFPLHSPYLGNPYTWQLPNQLSRNPYPYNYFPGVPSSSFLSPSNPSSIYSGAISPQSQGDSSYIHENVSYRGSTADFKEPLSAFQFDLYNFRLIRRKTKAIDRGKCSILSHVKTLQPLAGRNWDDNDGLRPSYDTLPLWYLPTI